MKVVAFATLHYGLDFLRESVRSVIDAVSEFWFIYTPTPTFGFQTDAVCPEHAYDLYEAAQEAAGNKCHWFTASPHQFRNEGEHVDYSRVLAPDADVYVRLDVDEVWTAGLLQAGIDFAVRENVRSVRLPMVHLWRGFYKGITDDPAYPDRITYMRGALGTDRTFRDAGVIWHFGYAQNSAVVKYKQDISAHRNEWRADWYDTKFAVNAQVDVHPVNGNGWWNPTDVDPFALGLPEYMRQHPYAALEVIP